MIYLKLFDTLVMVDKGIIQENNSIQSEIIKQNKEKHILIVDNSLINLKLTQEIINKFGFTSSTAKDGQEAVDIFKEKGEIFDVILIDENMPIMNGTKAIKIIRSLVGGDKPYIYGLTGDSDEKVNQAMINAGVDAILQKPIKIKELKDILF
ncbi:sensory box histidine kinase/response regulator [hydrothermal vent metagenome]|uniref:Sensory box histidine kinase/response regulator n=1 Tax=hydrothermal vent metagenome TaxID=652676 RepID=A0A1W1EKX8_9ZZZZ